MIKIDIEMPKSCYTCELCINCDACEGYEMRCALIGPVGYDPASANDLINDAPICPEDRRHKKCPLIEDNSIKHGKWVFDKNYPMLGSPYGSYKCSECGMHTDDDVDHYCWFCGADMRKEGETE